MTLSSGIDGARLTVGLDLRYPHAYLALQPTIAFGASQGIDINWLPLATQTLKPPSEPAEGDDRGIRHRRYRAQAIAREIETYAEAQGLVLKDYYRDGPAHAANLGWLWVRDRHPESLQPFLEELFRAYWALELDPADAGAVAALVDASCGASGEGASFAAWAAAEGPGAAASLEEELRERGLFQGPAFVVEDEVFYGRQHLPMISWILDGRSGRVPI